MQDGRIAGNLPVVAHFPQCNPDGGIEPVEDYGEGHKITDERILVPVVLQFVQQYVSDLAEPVYPGCT